MWTSALSRPRWAIPMTTSCAPASAPSSIASSSIGTSTSIPSSENCFCPRNERRRYCSNPSTCVRRRRSADALLGLEVDAKAARLDRLAEPDALGVVGDVLDLVGTRARVDLAEARERLEQRVTRHGQPEQARGYPGLDIGGQRRNEACLVQRGVAHRLGAEWIEPRREVAVHPVGLDERHRGSDRAQQGRVDRPGCRLRLGGASRRRLPTARRGRSPVPWSRPRSPAARAVRPQPCPRVSVSRRRPRRCGATRAGRSRERRGSPRGAGRRTRRSARSGRVNPSHVL